MLIGATNVLVSRARQLSKLPHPDGTDNSDELVDDEEEDLLESICGLNVLNIESLASVADVKKFGRNL
jgi:hypothetical protein